MPECWSPRAQYRILKVGPTIADLEGAEGMLVDDVGEDMQHGSVDPELWV